MAEAVANLGKHNRVGQKVKAKVVLIEENGVYFVDEKAGLERKANIEKKINRVFGFRLTKQ